MIGTLRFNFYVAAAAFLITFLFSVTHNIIVTTLLRSLYSFVLVFALTFVVRYVLGTIVGLKHMTTAAEDGEAADEAHKGNRFDAVTPNDESDLHQMLKPGGGGEAAEFAPLKPPKLSSKATQNPDELAQALRRMTEE